MTREEIRKDIPNMPSRIETMKASDFAAYAAQARNGERSLYEVMFEIYEQGIVDGRMWQLNIDEKKKERLKSLPEYEGQEFYTLKEASEILRVTYRSALTYVRTGKLPAKKWAGQWLISVKDLERFGTEN